MSGIYRSDKLHDLAGRTALVTGGGTGIGLMIAQGLAANGAKVYIAGRRRDVLEKVANAWDKQIGAIRPLTLDVTDKTSIVEARKVIEREEGKLHILVNNAGQVGPVTSTSDLGSQDAQTLGEMLFQESQGDWAKVYVVNTCSIYYVTSAFLGLLDKGSQDEQGYTSSVVNITSISGIAKLSQHHFAYNSSKAAASHLTRMLSTEFALKKIGVRVNAIAPGVYESEMTKDVLRPDDVDKIGKGVIPVPAERAGTAQEMIGTVLYLASRTGCYTNGQEIVVDGGYVAVNPSRV